MEFEWWCIGHYLLLCECADLWLKTDGFVFVLWKTDGFVFVLCLFEWRCLIWCSLFFWEGGGLFSFFMSLNLSSKV